MNHLLRYLLLFAVGSVAGTLNVIAGGGSFITLPVLIFLGLPGTVANGTNRVAILLQSIGATWSFHRHKVLDWRWLLWGAIPASMGAVIGAWIALHISDQAFNKILGVLMVVLSLWTLWDPLKRKGQDKQHENPRPFILGIGFLIVGVYGGFVQAGVGFLILAATTLAGLDLVHGNAVKVMSILFNTIISLSMFVWQGKVNWPMGLSLAVGNTLGGLFGVRLTVVKGHAWVKGVVTIAVIVFAVKLLLR